MLYITQLTNITSGLPLREGILSLTVIQNLTKRWPLQLTAKSVCSQFLFQTSLKSDGTFFFFLFSAIKHWLGTLLSPIGRIYRLRHYYLSQTPKWKLWVFFLLLYLSSPSGFFCLFFFKFLIQKKYPITIHYIVRSQENCIYCTFPQAPTYFTLAYSVIVQLCNLICIYCYSQLTLRYNSLCSPCPILTATEFYLRACHV